MRRVLFWAHLAVGVAASALILFFSVTGALLAYERQVLQVADGSGVVRAGIATQVPRLPLERVLANAAGAIGAPLDSVVLHAGPGASIEVQTASRALYRVDAFSGRIEGPLSPRLRSFFARVTALHRWFGSSPARHGTAILVKGGTCVALLFLLGSGAYLWLPRQWSRAAVGNGLVPQLHLRGRAQNYNWHKVAGAWIGLPLAIVVLTGTIMAYPWANALLFRMAGSPLPNRSADAATGGQPHRALAREAASTPSAFPPQLDEAFAQATGTTPGWQSASLRLTPGRPGLLFILDTSGGGHPEQRTEVSLDSTTRAVKKVTRFNGLSRGQQWRSWVRFVHTGEAGGAWGETLALLTACGAILLSISGVLLSLDRLGRWRAQR